jgi:hypothetical protein
LRCPRCGNENAGTNRFCGMCGASLISGPAPSAASAKDAKTPTIAAQQGVRAGSAAQSGAPVSTASAVASATPPAREPSPSQPARSDSGITGPSFLGLNDPPSHADTRHPARVQSASDHLESSHSVDYLLEDEEEEPKRGWGKLLLVLIALGLALGFGYLHWKQGGFDWVTGGKRPQTTSPDSSLSNLSNAAPAPAAAATQPAPPSSSPPDQSSAQSSAPTTAANGPAPSNSNATPNNSSPAPSPQPPAVTPTNALQTAPASAADSAPSNGVDSQDSKPPAPAQKSAAADEGNPESQSSDSATQPVAEAAPKPKPRPAKPSPAAPVSLVAEAERYIYGRGVTQDCDHGLRVLKRAADYDPKAMTAMGNLYSTGTCTPRDLPTAYRWYAQALHKDPDNQTLQNDLQSLWSQMTQPERQLAIRLSQ